MNTQAPVKSNRIYSIDAVRATALIMILITHSILGFWSNGTAAVTTMDHIFTWIRVHLTSDVGFSIFCFLFGLSFFLQIDHAEQKGIDFRLRFCWRLLLLLGFAVLDRLCYRGDILALFAIMGLLPVIFSKLKTRYVVFVTIICLIQPLHLYSWVCDQPIPVGLDKPQVIDPATSTWWEIACWNVTHGFLYSAVVYATSGRYFAVAGYFLLGMLAGRYRLFEGGTAKVAKLILPLFLLYIATGVPEHYYPDCRSFHWWRCETQMAFMVCALAWFYEQKCIASHLTALRALGRCTLTGYISQNAIMCLLLYPWGFGLSSELSLSGRVGVGIVLLIVQIVFFTYWLKRHKYGPLESVWRTLTRIGLH